MTDSYCWRLGNAITKIVVDVYASFHEIINLIMYRINGERQEHTIFHHNKICFSL
jgi:hypothetical protein